MDEMRIRLDRLATKLIAPLQSAQKSLPARRATWQAPGVPPRQWSTWSVRGHAILPLLVYAVGYLIAESAAWRLSFALSPKIEGNAPLIMHGAVLVAVLLLVPPKRWWLYLVLTAPLIAVNAWLFRLSLSWSLIWVLLLLYLGMLSVALGMVSLLRRFVGVPLRFASVREVNRFVLCACGAAVLAAFVFTAGRIVLFDWTFWFSLETAYLGTVLAILVFTPAIVLGATTDLGRLRTMSRWRLGEAVLLALGLLVVSAVVFGMHYQGSRLPAPLIYLVVPLLLLAAVRFGPRGISGALALTTLVAITGATQGVGPFVGQSAFANVFALQLFLIFVGVPLFFLAATSQERAETEGSLRTSEARYRAVVETQTELITRYKPDTTLTFVNDAVCRFDGKSREELLGTSILADMPEEAATRVRAMIEALLAEPEPGIVTIEHEARYQDGSLHWQQWVNRTIRDAEGQVIELQGIGRDITERKQAEEALRASEARYRAVVRHLPQTAVLLFDGERRHTFADGPGLQALGLTPEELEGRTVEEAFPRELAVALAPQYDAALAGQSVAVDVEHGQHTYHTQVVPIPADAADSAASGARGGHAGMVVVRDVTARRRARDELERERTRSAVLAARSQEFQTLAEHSPDFIARFDPAGRLQYVNQAAAGQLGRPAEHWVGKPLVELGLPQDVAARWGEGLRGVVTTQLPGTFDAEVRSPDGQIRSLHTRYVPEVAEDGTLQSVLGIATDVSALKQAEARLAEQAGELKAIFEAQADGVVVYDREGRVVRANRAWQAFFRHFSDLFGLGHDPTFAELSFTEQVERWDQLGRMKHYLMRDAHGHEIPMEEVPVYRALRGETVTGPDAVDERVVSPDGQVFEMSVSAAPIRDAAGQIVGAVAVAREVTSQRLLERQVREQASQLEAIFEAQADGVGVFDLQGRFLRANRALRQLEGFGDDTEYLTLPLTARAQRLHFFAGTEQPLAAEQWPHWRALHGEAFAGADALEVRLRTLDGREVWTSITGAPVRTPDRQITGGVLVMRDVTARRALERQVAEQERQYHTLVDHLPDVVSRFDRTGRRVYASPNAAAVLGLPAEESVGKRYADLGLAESVYAPWHRALQEVLATGEPREIGTTLPSGIAGEQSRHYRVRYIPELGADGTVESVVSIATDVSALKQAEALLAEQAGQLEAIFEAQADGVLVYDREGRMVRANRAWQAMFRAFADLNEWSADPTFAALPFAAQVERWHQSVRGRQYALRDVDGHELPLEQTPTYRALHGETLTGANAVDERFDRADGHVFVTSVSAAPIRDAAGGIIGAVAVSRDVTMQRQLERQVQEQASQLEAIFEAQADGVGVFDREGRFVRANSALRQLLGFDADPEYLTRPLAERTQQLQVFDVNGQRLAGEQAIHWRALRGETFAGANALELFVRTLDGREIWTSATGAPIRAPDGQITGAVLVTRDVTARRALERQVAEQANELEAIFEAQADVVVVYDHEGRFVRGNRAWEDYFQQGADRHELSTQPEFAALPVADQVARLNQQVQDEQGHCIPVEDHPTSRALRGETVTGSTAVDERFQLADGRDVLLSVSAAPSRDRAGNIVGAVVVGRDVTARRQLERQVAEQERQLRTLMENTPDIIARFDRDLRYLYINPAIGHAFAIAPEAYLGKTNAEVGWPEAVYAPVHRAIAQVFATGQSCTLEEIDDTTHPEHWYQARFLPEFAEDDTVASVLTITTEITELKRTEQALRTATAAAEAARQEEQQRRREAERREEIAESLRGVLAVLNSNRSLPEVLDHVVRQVEYLLGSEAAAIYGVDSVEREGAERDGVDYNGVDHDDAEPGSTAAPTVPRAETLTLKAAHGLRLTRRHGRSQQRPRHLPFAHAAVQRALDTRLPIAFLRAEEPPEEDTGASGMATGTAMPVERGVLPAPYQALLVVPIRVYDEVYGCLLLFSTTPRQFEVEEVALALAYADQAGLAIANARLQAHIAQEATVAERNRLARELHDTVTQEIFSASLLAESLPRNWQTQRAVAEASLQQLHGLTRGALAGLRVLLLELRPAELEQMPLAQLLRQLGAALSTRAGVAITVELDDSREDVVDALPIDVKVAIYRMAQEALTNAAKHAAARSITVRLRTRRTGGLVLEIADDGRGFDPEAIPSGHLGLTMLRERAQAVGASVRVQSRPGQGTRVVAEWRPNRSSRINGTSAPESREEAGDERARARAGTRASAHSRRDR
jgi:PAS domain S-box-containing protein